MLEEIQQSESKNVHVRANTDWFHDAKWGVFMHYLPDSTNNSLTVDEWNRRIDQFDVQGLATQLAEVKAGYFYITLGQNSGFFLSPNATYDNLVGRSPSRCSERDLISELYTELNKFNIPLMVYLPSHAPTLDRQAVEGLKCTPLWDASNWQLRPGTYNAYNSVDERLTDFQRNWEAVISEWSLRWEKNVNGWWIDGCYFANIMYRHDDKPGFSSFTAAMKAGNPDSIVAFNLGVKMPVETATEYEDYTAGEISGYFPINGKEPAVIPINRYLKGAQYHILTFLGHNWGTGYPRINIEMLIGYTRHVNDFGGVITWDIASTPKGRIISSHMNHLKALREATR